MLTHEHFLKQIKAQPDNDLPRLIYADWLEEQGDPRAELLRVVCQMPILESEEKRNQLLTQGHSFDRTELSSAFFFLDYKLSTSEENYGHLVNAVHTFEEDGTDRLKFKLTCLQARYNYPLANKTSVSIFTDLCEHLNQYFCKPFPYVSQVHVEGDGVYEDLRGSSAGGNYANEVSEIISIIISRTGQLPLTAGGDLTCTPMIDFFFEKEYVPSVLTLCNPSIRELSRALHETNEDLNPNCENIVLKVKLSKNYRPDYEQYHSTIYSIFTGIGTVRPQRIEIQGWSIDKEPTSIIAEAIGMPIHSTYEELKQVLQNRYNIFVM